MPPVHILVSGATGGIGRQLTYKALQFYPEARIYALARNEAKLVALKAESPDPARVFTLPVDLSREASIEILSDWLGPLSSHLDLAIHTLGILNGGGQAPEKSLRDIAADNLIEAFTVNTFSALWLGKALKPFFRRPQRSVLMFLSAKVGSINDNRLGGWYAYRMSKAALNMGIRNMALEYARSACPTIVSAVHPGTTLTDFSRDHVRGFSPERLAEPDVTAERLLRLAETLEKDHSGHFFHWDGSPLPW